MASGRNRRSSRRSLGSSPARRNDDLPAPDGPRITNSDSTPDACASRAARPGRAESGRRGRRTPPRRPPPAVPTPDTGRGRDRPAAATGNARPQSPARANHPAAAANPTVSNTTGCAAIGDVHFGGGAVAGEQVAALPLRGDVGVGHRLQPGAQDGLVQVLGVAELGLAFARRFSQCFDSRQITASQRALACCSACFHRSPGRIPVCGSKSK